MQAPTTNTNSGASAGAVPAVEPSGLVFDIQRYSVHDGPGIRTTVFLKGCPLRCTWCHNPESQLPGPELAVQRERCIDCGECAQVCPTGAAEEGNEGTGCTLCGACVDVCPTGARKIVGHHLAIPQLLEELLKDRVFFDDSGGGVTFSGGEPLAQPAFLLAALQACQREGLHTAVDTCGYAPTETLLEIAPFADLFLFDIKAMDDAVHRRHTGVSNALIIENLRALSGVHDAIWIRIPVISGVNDSPDQSETIADLVHSLSGIQQVNLLPYHRTGTQKNRRLNRSENSQELQPPDDKTLTALLAPFWQRGIPIRIGG